MRSLLARLASLAFALTACAGTPPNPPRVATAPTPPTPAAPSATVSPPPEANGFARFRLAHRDEARAALGAPDAFVTSLGPLDRALRLASTAPVAQPAYLAFAADQAAEWAPAEEARVRRAIDRIGANAKNRGLDLARVAPPEITMVKTTGKEEFGLPYTRGTAILLPAGVLAKVDDNALTALLTHELFHVVSRHSAPLRERAYRLIGFERGGDLAIPSELEAPRITNPDGYQNDFQLALPANNGSVRVVPFLISTRPGFDPAIGNFVLDYADLKLLAVEPAGAGVRALRTREGKLDLRNPQNTDYLHCLGQNSEEIIHPDEVMADNFVRVLARAEPAPAREPTPELVNDFETLLRTGEAVPHPEGCRF